MKSRYGEKVDYDSMSSEQRLHMQYHHDTGDCVTQSHDQDESDFYYHADPATGD